MKYPDLLTYQYEDEYRDHYNLQYCKGPLTTFDGISVRFRKNDFIHLCHKDDDHDGDREEWCWDRATRIHWIEAALKDSDADLYFGWDSRRQKTMFERRVCLVNDNYQVTIQMVREWEAVIITAFPPKQRNVITIRQRDPSWVREKTIYKPR